MFTKIYHLTFFSEKKKRSTGFFSIARQCSLGLATFGGRGGGEGVVPFGEHKPLNKPGPSSFSETKKKSEKIHNLQTCFKKKGENSSSSFI